MADQIPTQPAAAPAGNNAPAFGRGGQGAGGRGGQGGKIGQNKGPRRKVSRYGTQIQEKKALKELYGIREEQLKNYYKKALRSKEETGPALITMLERRLDNAVFRSGMAQTRPQARQMSTHGFFTVNGVPVDIPSYLLKTGDVVAVKENKRSKPYFSNFDKRMQSVRTPSWVSITADDYSFKFTALPDVEEANVGVDMRAIVEFFTR